MKEGNSPYFVMILIGITIVPLILLLIVGIFYILIFTLLHSKNIFELIVAGIMTFDMAIVLIGLIRYAIYNTFFNTWKRKHIQRHQKLDIKS